MFIIGFAKSEATVKPIPAKRSVCVPFSKTMPVAILETSQRENVSNAKCLRIFFIVVNYTTNHQLDFYE